MIGFCYQTKISEFLSDSGVWVMSYGFWVWVKFWVLSYENWVMSKPNRLLEFRRDSLYFTCVSTLLSILLFFFPSLSLLLTTPLKCFFGPDSLSFTFISTLSSILLFFFLHFLSSLPPPSVSLASIFIGNEGLKS